MCVTLVRQTEQPLLEAGRQLLPLVHAAGTHWYEAKPLPAAQRDRLATKLPVALAAHPRRAKQSRRLTPGKPLPHCTIVMPMMSLLPHLQRHEYLSGAVWPQTGPSRRDGLRLQLCLSAASGPPD